MWTALLFTANAQNGPVLKSYDQPVYPPIARAARVEGSVTVEFLLDDRGEPTSVSTITGNAMLKSAAEKFVKTWKFDLQGLASVAATPYRTTIHFKLIRGVVETRDVSNLTVSEDSYRSFEVTALIGDVQLSKCPTEEDEQVPTEKAPDDFVEVSRSGCYGSCPSYSARVSADGTVNWNGFGSVEAKGQRTARIDSASARGLIERFRTRKFWSLCGDYTRSITDSATTTVDVKIGGRSRSVSDYADSAPVAEQDLELAIDEVSNSHLWRHGDPAREPITRLSSDSYLPKPGFTPLMRSASSADIEKLSALIGSGADLNQTDASGWSALMYAAAGNSSKIIELLLKAGANPNQSSLRGDTPLIASASEGQWDDDLVRAGTLVNAQNEEGQTALMFLAARAEVDEIRDALKAGANVSQKDAKGRTAADYLRQASCGKSPLSDPLTNGWMALTSNKCNALDADDVRAAKKLLDDAGRRTK
jgi:TonB family protein